MEKNVVMLILTHEQTDDGIHEYSVWMCNSRVCVYVIVILLNSFAECWTFPSSSSSNDEGERNISILNSIDRTRGRQEKTEKVVCKIRGEELFADRVRINQSVKRSSKTERTNERRIHKSVCLCEISRDYFAFRSIFFFFFSFILSSSVVFIVHSYGMHTVRHVCAYECVCVMSVIQRYLRCSLRLQHTYLVSSVV